MIYYAVVILLLKVLVILLKCPTELLAMEFNYPIRNMSVFITDSKLSQFVSNDGGNYTQMLNSPHFIYVVSNGNELLKLSKDTMNVMDKFFSKSSCTKEDVCEQMHINVVKLNKEKGILWFCFAYKTITNNIIREEQPNCYLPSDESLVKNHGQWQAQTFTSSDFEHRTITLTASQFIYSGLYFYVDKQLQIFRNELPFSDNGISKIFTRLPLSYLKGPGDFILSFQYKYSIYFLLLETDFSCGFWKSKLQARLVRLCQDDRGSSNSEFTSLAKINVNCEQKSPSSSIPSFFYSVASAASWMPLNNELVVSFISSKNDSSSSVVCLYSIKAIEDSFNSDLRKASEKPTYNRNSYPDTCNNFSVNSQSQEYIADITAVSKSYPLRKKVLSSVTIFQERNGKILHMSSDEAVWSSQRRVMLFLSVEYRRQSAIVILSLHPKFCVIEKFLTPEKITALELINDDKPILLIGTSQRLIVFPMDRCQKYNNEAACISVLNPYCGWNTDLKMCRFISSEEDSKFLSHLKSICPQISKDIDDINSKWEMTCPLFSTNDPLKQIGTCTCRTKTSGQRGINVSVLKNCKVDGDWSPFSDWSDCSVTCDSGTQSRYRTCDSPVPKNGGKMCQGLKMELRYCTTNIECKKTIEISSQTEQFSQWSSWSTCSATCGFSFTIRNRNCLSENCKSNPTEMKLCRFSSCQSSMTSEWSEWSKYNHIAQSKKRLRIHCNQAYFYRPCSMTVQLLVGKNHTENCVEEQCFDRSPTKVLSGIWTKWSSKTHCSATCGIGVTTRSRHCSNNKCLGSAIEVSRCNTHPCKSTWSCWSNWIGCSTTCETPSTRTRHRYCMHDPLNIGCVGSNIEEAECTLIQCPLSYTQWSMWSSCSHEGHIIRTRKCKSKQPCLFSLKQSRLCAVASTNKIVLYSSIYMIVSGLLGLFVGVVVGSVICYIWWRCTLMVIHKANSGSIRFNNLSPREDIYASQSLITLPDTGSTVQRQRSISNSELYYQSQYVPQYRDEGDYYAHIPPPTFFDPSGSYNATARQTLPDVAEI